jgi:hypothetical protein
MAAKTPAPRQPKAPGKYGEFSTANTVPDKYLFATDAEIENRIATGYETNPAAAAPSFKQIRPGPTGKSANEPTFKQYGGGPSNYDGNPRRYA